MSKKIEYVYFVEETAMNNFKAIIDALYVAGLSKTASNLEEVYREMELNKINSAIFKPNME